MNKIKDPRVVEPLITALKDTDLSVRLVAALALGEIKDPRAIKPLIDALKDGNAEVRDRLADALVKFGGAALQPLIVALNDKDADLRDHSAHILVKFGKVAVEPLLASLKKEDQPGRLIVAAVLSESEDPRAVQCWASGVDERGHREELRILHQMGLAKFRFRGCVDRSANEIGQQATKLTNCLLKIYSRFLPLKRSQTREF